MRSAISVDSKAASQGHYNFSVDNVRRGLDNQSLKQLSDQFRVISMPLQAAVGTPIFGAIFSTFIVSAMMLSFLNNANKDRVKNPGSAVRSYVKDSVNYGAGAAFFEAILTKSFNSLVIDPYDSYIKGALAPFYDKHKDDLQGCSNFFSNMTTDNRQTLSQYIESLSQSPFINEILSTPSPSPSPSMSSAAYPVVQSGGVGVA